MAASRSSHRVPVSGDRCPQQAAETVQPLCHVFRRRRDDLRRHALRQRVGSDTGQLARVARPLDQQAVEVAVRCHLAPGRRTEEGTSRSGSVAAISRPSTRSNFLRSGWRLNRPHGRGSLSSSFRGHSRRAVTASFLRFVVFGLGGSPRGLVAAPGSRQVLGRCCSICPINVRAHAGAGVAGNLISPFVMRATCLVTPWLLSITSIAPSDAAVSARFF